MRPADPALPLVFDRADALRAGLSEGQVRRRAAARWDRLRRGHFTAARLTDEDRWRAAVLAVLRAHQRPLVLSHSAAARAWGLPSPIGGWPATTFTSVTRPARRAAGCVVLAAPLSPADIVTLGAVQVTSVARTVVDCARSLPPRDALAIADAALHRGLTDRTALAAALAEEHGWWGVSRARQVLDLVDGRRETPLESWSAWAFAVHAVPAPAWQVTITDSGGVFLGRVDSWWDDGVAGEADGDLKYRLAAAERGGLTGEALAAVVDDERRRERGLRRSGAQVVRWSAVDVLDDRRAEALAALLLDELSRADGHRFRGRAMLLGP